MGSELLSYQVLEAALNPELRQGVYDELMGSLEINEASAMDYLNFLAEAIKPIVVTGQGVGLMRQPLFIDSYPGLSARINFNDLSAKYIKFYEHGDAAYCLDFNLKVFRDSLIERFRVVKVKDEYYILCPTSFTIKDDLEGGFALDVAEDHFRIYDYDTKGQRVRVHTKLPDGQLFKEVVINGFSFKHELPFAGPALKGAVFLHNLIDDLCFGIDSQRSLFDEAFYVDLISFLTYHNPKFAEFAPKERYDLLKAYHDETKWHECSSCRSQREDTLYASLREFLPRNYLEELIIDQELIQFFYEKAFSQGDEDLAYEVYRLKRFKPIPELVNESLQNVYYQLIIQEDVHGLRHLSSWTGIKAFFPGINPLMNELYYKKFNSILKSIKLTRSGKATINLEGLIGEVKDLYLSTSVKPLMKDLLEVHNLLIEKQLIVQTGKPLIDRLKDLIMSVAQAGC